MPFGQAGGGKLNRDGSFAQQQSHSPKIGLEKDRRVKRDMRMKEWSFVTLINSRNNNISNRLHRVFGVGPDIRTFQNVRMFTPDPNEYFF